MERAAMGLDVISLPASAAAGDLEALAASGGRQPGIIATVKAMARRCDALCDVLPDALRAHGVDLVIGDQTEPGAALSAMACGLPYASLACALPLDREPGLPPPFVDWEHRPDGGRLWLYEGGHRVTDWLMRPLSRAIRRRAESFGIAGVRRLDDTFSTTLQLFQLARGLDFPRAVPPANAHWVGPLRDADASVFEHRDDGRPLAFCSLGTLQGHRIDLFRSIAEAVAKQGLRPVIAHGGRLSPAQAATLPGDPITADFLPQRAVLALSRLAVVHGGLNTVLDALAAGVPLVVTPLAYEQGAIAARVAASGAGLMVSPRRAGRDLAQACGRVLKEPGFAARAGALGREIASSGGVERAADLIEQLLAAHSRN